MATELRKELVELYEENGVKQFLDELRESGETNMWGAAPYVQREFGFSKKVSDAFVQKWMDEFK